MAYAAVRPKARGLYLAFGKPTQLEASSRLKDLAGIPKLAPATVSHGQGLARSSKPPAGCPRTTRFAPALPQLLGVNWAIAKAVNETVKNYMCSADATISDKYLPDERDCPIGRAAAGVVMDDAALF